MSLLFYVGKRRGYKTFAGAKVQQKNDMCKKMPYFLSKRTKREPILQLSGFDEVDDPFGDAVFVGGVVFLFEVVFEEFGNELPPVRTRLTAV